MMESEKKSKILHQITSTDSLPSLSPLTIQLIEAASDELEKVLKDLVAYSQIYKPFIITALGLPVDEKRKGGRPESIRRPPQKLAKNI